MARVNPVYEDTVEASGPQLFTNSRDCTINLGMLYLEIPFKRLVYPKFISIIVETRCN